LAVARAQPFGTAAEPAAGTTDLERRRRRERRKWSQLNRATEVGVEGFTRITGVPQLRVVERVAGPREWFG